MKIAFNTLGCKLNYAETATYERGLMAAGWEVVPWTDVADVYLINTCAVTETAEKKSRNLIRRAHKTAPEARIVVTGCYAELRKEQLLALDGVWRVFGANEKSSIVPETLLVAEEGVVPETHGHPRPCKREGPTAASSDALRVGRGRSEAKAVCETVPSFAVKFIYVIPDFNNPTGKTLSLAEREELVALARELDCLIVEDSPYRELRYSGEAVTSIRELAPERTLQLGSFSKIFAPGFRLGWIIGPEELLEQIYVCKQCLDLCPPVLDQYLASEFLGSGLLDANLVKTIAEYRRRRDLMVSLLEKYMPSGVSWTYPEGGLFLWLTLPPAVDTVALYDKALVAGVAYVAGSFFYTDGSHRNTMRLNFSFVDEAKMEPGIKLLASLVREADFGAGR